jgi:hypothetical protein
MLRLYVIACSGLAALSLLVWGLVATYSLRLVFAPARPDESALGVLIAMAIILLYPVLVIAFGIRSWRYLRLGDDLAAAGPSTLIGVSALALLALFASVGTAP